MYSIYIPISIIIHISLKWERNKSSESNWNSCKMKSNTKRRHLIITELDQTEKYKRNIDFPLYENKALQVVWFLYVLDKFYTAK